MNFFSVITTIQTPSVPVVEMIRKIGSEKGSLIVIGDAAGPKAFSGVNVYCYFTDETIWPRGFPLDEIHTPVAPASETISPEGRAEGIHAPIQQALVNNSLNEDAI